MVFFGESVPRDQVAAAQVALEEADAMLVVGSSLMVYSGFRFAQMAAHCGMPIAGPVPTTFWRSRSRTAARRRFLSCCRPTQPLKLRAGGRPAK